MHSVPFGYEGRPIRRAQALAVANGLDLAIARELIAASSKASAASSFGRPGARVPHPRDWFGLLALVKAGN
ncbi:MAG: hypothetical protein JO104_11575 [Candidatus Eremiobacteraeota bacterium]|nr:hypothetical protein [Candidatus Eremiobacteraeota bacterium]